ncbi:MAG TPA: ABC transporter ATP-binding protein [Planctomycetota bacterium]|nr:ABC transporter ATP-binding protein [Planctomycetota bacterium]
MIAPAKPEPGPAAPQAPVKIWGVTWRFFRRARRYLPRIALTLGVVLVASGAKTVQGALVGPVINRFSKPAKEAPPPAAKSEERSLRGVVDRFIHPEQWHLRQVAVLAIGLSVIMFVFGYLRDIMTNWLTNRVVADLRNDVAEHLAYLPLGYHYDRKSGDLVSRITNDVSVSESATNFYFDDVIVHPITIAWALFWAFYTSPRLAMGALLLFPVYALVLARLARRMRRARKRSLEHLGDMTGTMIQTFGGIKTVKAFNSEAQQVAEFREHNDNFFRKLMAALRRKALGENISQLFMGLAVAFLLVGGYKMMETGAIDAGGLATFSLMVAMINSSVRELSKSYNRLVEASTGCERVFELLDQPRETEHEDGEELSKVDRVEYRGVTFAYDGEPVLRDVNFLVRPGQVVAVVGRSGAGKTTLLDLLCRFYDPQQGDIAVNGTVLRKVKRSSLLGHVAVVTQETFLFNTTVGENIRYGRRNASQPEVETAAKAAFIHDFIQGLEKGYDTPVGERGAKLSGGQRQRLAIARAILRDPSILILDEATSALDAESEQAVQAALQNLIRSEHRITFVIAHRLSTIKNADRILVLDQGRLVEEGRHDELLAKGGVYASLYRTQFTET